MTDYSIWDNQVPSGDFNLYTDGTPSIATMNRFYIFGEGLPGGSIKGGRVWIPSNATVIPPQVRMQWYTDGYAAGVPAAEKIVDITVPAGNWQNVDLDLPLPLPANGVLMAVVVKFEPEAYDDFYVYAANGKAGSTRQDSLSLPTLCWSDWDGETYSSQNYRSPWNNNTIQQPASTGVNYGTDIVLTDTLTLPGDNDSVYAKLLADGHTIREFVVEL